MRLLLPALLILIAAITINACASAAQKDATSADTKVVPALSAATNGFLTMESSCFTCHSPNALQTEDLAAPTMADMKLHYLKFATTERAFADALNAFVQQPDSAHALMAEAVKRFGLMPKLGVPEKDARDIAHYLFNNKIEAADWFPAQYQAELEKHRKAATPKTILEIGQEQALVTKALLGKNLLMAINNKGAENAVAFCNTRALPLTDSMSGVYNARIKRVSDQPRNPKNAADKYALAYIAAAKTTLANGGKVAPKMQKIGNKTLGYYPIETTKMCLQCHGNPNQDIKPATLETIKKLYPQDKAVGYKELELRGIWVVELQGK